MSLTSAYGAGWRAGMAPSVIARNGNYCPHTLQPLKSIVEPECPYKRWWQFLLALVWHDGVIMGKMESHRRWQASRGRV